MPETTQDWTCFICGFVIKGNVIEEEDGFVTISVDTIFKEHKKLAAAIDHLITEHGWGTQPKRSDTPPSKCPLPSMVCAEDGMCRQPDNVYCTCPVVNLQATDWLQRRFSKDFERVQAPPSVPKK